MDRWGFEEDDDDGRALPPADEPLTGADAGGIVTVAVDDAGDVRSVRLGDGWQDVEVRRELGAKVVEAMTAATARVMALRTEPPAAPVGGRQESPITAEDVLRVLDEVSVDLARFRERLSAIVDGTVRATSGGGHVTVSGRRRHVGEVSIDQDWLYGARAAEVESELRDALTSFCHRSSLGELADGPRSDAIDELLSMVADPQAMVRRIKGRAS